MRRSLLKYFNHHRSASPECVSPQSEAEGTSTGVLRGITSDLYSGNRIDGNKVHPVGTSFTYPQEASRINKETVNSSMNNGGPENQIKRVAFNNPAHTPHDFVRTKAETQTTVIVNYQCCNNSPQNHLSGF